MHAQDQATVPLDDLKQRVEELFLQVCADPDDKEAADSADRVLRQLDQLMSG